MTTISQSGGRERPSGGKRIESISWLLMRYSGILLIPLVWIHVLIQDVLVGAHAIDLDYVAMRWAMLGWRIYDITLLAFAFAHGMNGFRGVLDDYITNPTLVRIMNAVLFLVWIIISVIGAVAIVAGVRTP
jgi:succinate dehydrogenase / fumarate reductase membrane anchor subunit